MWRVWGVEERGERVGRDKYEEARGRCVLLPIIPAADVFGSCLPFETTWSHRRRRRGTYRHERMMFVVLTEVGVGVGAYIPRTDEYTILDNVATTFGPICRYTFLSPRSSTLLEGGGEGYPPVPFRPGLPRP